MSKLSTGATFVVAQVLAVAVGVGGTTYVHAHEDDARKKKSLAKQIQAQVRAMAPTLTVGAAVNATNAAHAADSDRVGGAVVRRVSMRVDSGPSSTSLVTVNGLTVTVGCTGGKASVKSTGSAAGGLTWATVASKVESSSQGAVAVAGSVGSGSSGYGTSDSGGTFVASGRLSDGSSVYVSLTYDNTAGTYCVFTGLLVTG